MLPECLLIIVGPLKIWGFYICVSIYHRLYHVSRNQIEITDSAAHRHNYN